MAGREAKRQGAVRTGRGVLLALWLAGLAQGWPQGGAQAQSAPPSAPQTTAQAGGAQAGGAQTSGAQAGGAQATGRPGEAAARGPTKVGVLAVHAASVALVRTLPGRAIAAEAVAVRPEASGRVREILFSPGATVAAGEALFQLDDGPLRADLAAADAAVAGAQAGLAAAEATVARTRALAGRAVSEADQTAAVVALGQAQAQVKSAEAARDKAARALEDTRITSPVAGVAGLAEVAVGDLVTAGQADALVTVTRPDPVFVDVTEPAAEFLAAEADLAAGRLSPPAAAAVRIVADDGAVIADGGRLVRQGREVSATTGTVSARYAFDNGDGRLMPGQFLRVEVTKGTRRAILVPQRATRRATNGALTAFVVEGTGEAARARQVTLSEDGTDGSAWIVTGGIADGAALVLDNLDRLRDGAAVAPVAVTLDADGVVRDAPPGTPAPAASP